MQEYKNFLKSSTKFKQLRLVINTVENSQIQIVLYTQALKAHLTAIVAYIQLVSIHEQLFQRYLDSIHE
ncbi:hypothetical protein WA1_02110 [Scytonema hofmannii PCC 7110]|uniref:Uncharacterized protein n=1 Tax=Scytonema hofmannii PCC 7110 TaxID=128403 RepID=A0A139XH24_9CYAN|nr:hypothetical protein WA1_02110 [Scytonema hofmannii PCC 7110]